MGTSLLSQIRNHLQYNKPSKSASQAFAVEGTGRTARREAAAVMLGKKKPQDSFPANRDLSVIFFSDLFGSYVHLAKVEQQRGRVVICYRFVPHESSQLTTHIALVPLGKLSPGEVKVDIKRLPMQHKYLDEGFKELPSSWDSRIVSQPFRFRVEDKSD